MQNVEFHEDMSLNFLFNENQSPTTAIYVTHYSGYFKEKKTLNKYLIEFSIKISVYHIFFLGNPYRKWNISWQE